MKTFEPPRDEPAREYARREPIQREAPRREEKYQEVARSPGKSGEWEMTIQDWEKRAQSEPRGSIARKAMEVPKEVARTEIPQLPPSLASAYSPKLNVDSKPKVIPPEMKRIELKPPEVRRPEVKRPLVPTLSLIHI